MKNRPPSRKHRAAERRAYHDFDRDRKAVARLALEQSQQPTGFMVFRSVIEIDRADLPSDHPLVATSRYDNKKFIRAIGLISRFQARAVPLDRASNPVAQKQKLTDAIGKMKPRQVGYLGRATVIDDLRSAVPKSFVTYHFESPLQSALQAESFDLLACMGVQNLNPLTPRLAVHATTDTPAAEDLANQLNEAGHRIPITLGTPYPQSFRL